VKITEIITECKRKKSRKGRSKKSKNASPVLGWGWWTGSGETGADAGGIEEEEKHAGLDKWFRERWVNIGSKKKGRYQPCGTSGEKQAYAKCVPASVAAGMSAKEKASAVRRKRAAQSAAGRSGKSQGGSGKSPIRVDTKTGKNK
jgi:hypothetical protein